MALPLTRSVLESGVRSARAEALEIRLLLEGIFEQAGYDFRDYAPASLRSCIRRGMRAEGVDSVSRYQHYLLRDRRCLERLVAALAPSGKDLFDPPGYWLFLRRRIMPVLRTYPSVRIWVAGCATGTEAYGLAILMQEEGVGPRSTIYATELDEGPLSRAREGRISADRLTACSRNYRRAGGRASLRTYGSSAGEGLSLAGLAADRIVFASHSLATDASFNQFQLILCRDLLSRFARPLQARALDLFHLSLVPLGYLGLGAGDSLQPAAQTSAYERISTRYGIYRRLR